MKIIRLNRKNRRVAGLSAVAVLLSLFVVSCGQAPRPDQQKPQVPGFPDSDLTGFKAVDQHKKASELMALREIGGGAQLRFADLIGHAISIHEREALWSLGGNEPIFSFPPESERIPVSLRSHRLCDQTSDSLKATIGQSVSEDLAKSAQEVARRWNVAREDAAEFRRFESKLMGCLAYSESLTSADDPPSYEAARIHGPQGYQKPRGVKFYLDPTQTDPDSRLNIGLYQFSPVSRGNIQSCIRNWNSVYSQNPERQLDRRADLATMTRRLGDASQEFNAFCGVDKITQIFLVQVNTQSARRTHPSNVLVLQDGTSRLKAPRDRCVSLHFNAAAYNHFGPLQNSTGRNLGQLLSCILSSDEGGSASEFSFDDI